ncbi:MAG: DUF2569 domain-containing protein [Candidatus Marinimicrobia bacterium]|nr:DUF2569 domain-containing protein [Candidatus Neomarinimicrobiota bacterium]
MSKKFEEFGGWLKFFYFLCLLNIFTSVTMLFLLGGELFGEEGRPLMEILLEGVEIGITLYILYMIIQVVQVRKPDITEFIKDRLFIMFVVAVLYFLIHSLFTLPGAGWQMKNTVALAGSIQSMLWAAIWRTYFEKSERVKIYYKLEENEQNEDNFIQSDEKE